MSDGRSRGAGDVFRDRLAMERDELLTRLREAESALAEERSRREEAEREAEVLGDAYDRLVSAVIGDVASCSYCFDTTEYERAATDLRDRATRAESALAAASEAAKTYRLAMALALSIPVGNITVESAQAWIDDWKARNDD